MDMHYLIRRVAGTLVLVSLALAVWVSTWWLLLAAFVGVNLFQSSFTRWCPAETLLEMGGIARRPQTGATTPKGR